MANSSHSLDDVIRDEITKDEEAAAGYLLATLTNEVISALREVRTQASLTQAQMARRTNTTQSRVAALEGDTDGSPSFRRIAKYFLAAGVMPEVVLKKVASLREAALENFNGTNLLVKFEANTSNREKKFPFSSLNFGVESSDDGTNSDFKGYLYSSNLTHAPGQEIRNLAMVADLLGYQQVNPPLQRTGFLAFGGLTDGPELSLTMPKAYPQSQGIAIFGIRSGLQEGRTIPILEQEAS